MKTNFLFVFTFFTVSVLGQNIDSLAVKNEVDSLIRLNTQLVWEQKFDDARQAIEAAAVRAENAFGKNDTTFAKCLFNYANTLYYFGEIARANRFLQDARAIWGAVLGRGSIAYADKLEQIALAYSYDVVKKEQYFIEVINIREKSLGKDHPHYLDIVKTLCGFYYETFQPEKAKPIYLELTSVTEKTVGKRHRLYASTLTNLGHFSARYGSWDEAERYFLMAREAWSYVEKAEWVVAHMIIHSAWIRQDMGRVAKDSNNLSEAMNHYAVAGTRLLEAKKYLLEKNLANHHQYELCLRRLVYQYEATGRFNDMEQVARELIEFQKVNGFRLGNARILLAEMYLRQGRCAEAESLIKEYAETSFPKLIRDSHRLSAFDLAIQAGYSHMSQFYLWRQNFKSPCDLPQLRYDAALFYKGFLLDAGARLKNLARLDSVSAVRYARFQSCHERLANEYAKAPADRRDVDALETEAGLLEQELVRTVPGFSDNLRQVNWQEVRSALKPGEAAVEFMQNLSYYSKKPDSYTALILRAGDSLPVFIQLCLEVQLYSLLQTNGARKADYVNILYTLAERGAIPLENARESLYELLFKPLEPYLTGVKTLYFSPAGLLHRIALAAIPLGDETVVGDRYRLVALGSTRQLVIPHEAKIANRDAPGNSAQAMLFGGVQYEMDTMPGVIPSGAASSYSYIESRSSLSFFNADSVLRGSAWTFLKWAKKEVDSIKVILKGAGFNPVVAEGKVATEELFKSIGKRHASPRILHLATHGFFFPDPRGDISGGGDAVEKAPVFKVSENPMIRSGLILAGGNHAWATGKPLREGMEDGILTAYEISQMNLSNTELVVLSACETGLGDIQGNEGVYGLQRAFKIAGAKYLIMSLWQVPDKQTSLLMTTFYKKWLEEKMTIPEAFRAAQKELREAGLDPYQWAGFVLVE